MNRQDLLEQVQAIQFGHPLIWFESTDSTSTQAAKAVASGQTDHGAVFVAGQQTAGRGTDGNRWESSQPKGLWMSLVLRRESPSATAISLMPGIAIAKILRQKWGIDAHLKWPNDVLVEDRKIAGILVESIAQAAGVVHVVGIGVNLNQSCFEAELATIACSASMVLDRQIPLPIFFGQLMTELEHLWQRPSDWIECWTAMSRMVGRQILLKQNGPETVATVTGLSASGGLLAIDAQGKSREIISRAGLDVRII